ncbi:MAG: DUF2207 domain-containing protein [Candidatus Diapherotrites archaeon]
MKTNWISLVYLFLLVWIFLFFVFISGGFSGKPEELASPAYWVFLFLPSVFVALLFAFFWFLWGREPKVDYQAIYERDIPYDYSPAIVSALLNQVDEKPSEESITAIILDLCLKKFLLIERTASGKPGGKAKAPDYVIKVRKFSDDQAKVLPLHELMILDAVKEYAEHANPKVCEIALSQLKKKMEYGFGFHNSIPIWREQVRKEAEGMGLFGPVSPENSFILICVGLIFAGLLFLFVWPGLFIAGFAGIALNLVFKSALPKRTAEGARHYLKWMKFKAYLKHFGSLDKAKMDSVALWDKYLVYAIPLGIAKEVQKEMGLSFQSSEFADAMYSSLSSQIPLDSPEFKEFYSDARQAFGDAVDDDAKKRE